MTRSFATFWICLAAIVLTAPTLAHGETKSGDITLKSYSSPGDEPVAAQLGDKLKVTCKFSIQDFFGTQVISAKAFVENAGKDPMLYSYNVAFFDADHHLIGCAGQSNFRAPVVAGDKLQMGPIVMLPPELIAKVTSFQVTWYETSGDHF